MNDQPVERTRHISITRTGADGMVSQTEVHITAVHHRSVDTGSAAASVQTDVHIVTEGDCFDPRTCCDEREQALIAALRAYLRPDVAPECLIALPRPRLITAAAKISNDIYNKARLMYHQTGLERSIRNAKNQALGRLPWLAAFLRRFLRLRPRMPMMDSFAAVKK